MDATAGPRAGALPQAVVLVEGVSDQVAVEVLARRRGRLLAEEGIEVVSMYGATNIGHYLRRYGPRGLDVKLAGLYDSAEERHFLRALARSGIGLGLGPGLGRALGPDAAPDCNAASGPGAVANPSGATPSSADLSRADLSRADLSRADLSRADLEARGFFVCTADLEDELIRAVSAGRVVQLIEANGELASFRKLQQQPALRDRGLHHQLRRLMGGRSGGKTRYARLMAEAVDLDRVPRPLSALLDYI